MVVTEEDVRGKLQSLEPIHLKVTDESDGCGAKFFIEIVSSAFEKTSTLNCHRLVQKNLGNLFDQIHAVTINAYSPEKWEAKSKA